MSGVSDQLVPGIGTCGVMGIASTMALVIEARGMMAAAGASPPAVSSDRRRIAEKSGTLAVALAKSGLTPDRIMTEKACRNALTVLLACGGSTNALIHLTAIAGRVGIRIDLDAFDRIGRHVPVLITLKPSGKGYMEDLHDAGGWRRCRGNCARICTSTAGPLPGPV